MTLPNKYKANMTFKNDNKVCIKSMKPQKSAYLIIVGYGYIQRSLKFFKKDIVTFTLATFNKCFAFGVSHRAVFT